MDITDIPKVNSKTIPIVIESVEDLINLERDGFRILYHESYKEGVIKLHLINDEKIEFMTAYSITLFLDKFYLR